MKYKILLLLLAMAKLAAAQTVAPVLLASCTGEGNFNNGQIFWSLGELSVSTLGDTPYQITQGFWQPEALTITEANEPLQQAYGIACWPNPVTDGLHITFSLEKMVRISLYSMEGRLLLQESAIKNGHILSMASLPAAMYLLRFSTEDGKWILTQKIVKQ